MFHLLYISLQTCECSWSVLYLLTDAGGLCIRLFFLLGLCKLQKAPGFAFITDAATGIQQPGPVLAAVWNWRKFQRNSGAGHIEGELRGGISQVLDAAAHQPHVEQPCKTSSLSSLSAVMPILGGVHHLGLHVTLLFTVCLK